MIPRVLKITYPVIACLALTLASCTYRLGDITPAAAALLLSLNTESNSFTWANQQLTVDIGSQGVHDTLGVSHPAVILDGNVYRMWYTASDGVNNRILYAESSDGRSWSNFQLAININQSGTGLDSSRVYNPSVIQEGNLFKMWYSAGGVNVRTIYAESSDGVNWINFALALDINSVGAGVDDLHAFNAHVLSGYRIWYTAVNPAQDYQIATCASTTGTSFSSCQVSIPPGTEGTYDTLRTNSIEVIEHLGRYYAWFGGATASFNFDLLACDSDDGINWSNCGLSIPRGTQGVYDTNNVEGVAVLVVDGTARIWYSGSNGSNNRILYAESAF